MQELNPSGSAVKAYLWGLDLSGTLQGAGGIGGLIAQRYANETYFYTYDGNGNVSELIKKSDSTVAAHYEYDPFGNVVYLSGEMKDANRYRYSTKYRDPMSGLYYYGYRYYNPTTGRWINRDPLEEQGGLNLYAFVGNNGVNKVDKLGQKVLNPNGYIFADELFFKLWEFNRLIGCDRDVLITGGNRSSDSSLGSGKKSTHVLGIAADILVIGQSHIYTANQAAESGLFSGIGWYEEGYRGPNGEGPHVHVDLRTDGPARWGYSANGERQRGFFPKVNAILNSSECPCRP